MAYAQATIETNMYMDLPHGIETKHAVIIMLLQYLTDLANPRPAGGQLAGGEARKR